MNTEDDNYVRGWPLLLAATLECETEIENRDRPTERGGEYGTMEAPPETVIEFLSSYGNMV